MSVSSTDVHLVTSSKCHDVILDSGAVRHVHNVAADFKAIQQCAPQTLTGFMGKHVTVSSSGSVGDFDDVLFMPTSQAGVRSVGYMLNKKGGSVAFTTVGATYTSPSGSTRPLARRNSSGLYSVIPDAVDTSNVPVFISVLTQVRREAIHRLHQCLGHASIEKMRHIMKTDPHVCGSLTTRDLALFTSCRLGKARKARRPQSTYTRTTLFVIDSMQIPQVSPGRPLQQVFDVRY